MRDLELTPRLRRLADWVPPGARLADIGTDHGYLPVWLRLHGRVASAIACDLREGPLARARETGRTWGADGIDYRLGNGLAVVSPDEADAVVIAGMGGENIAAGLPGPPGGSTRCCSNPRPGRKFCGRSLRRTAMPSAGRPWWRTGASFTR